MLDNASALDLVLAGDPALFAIVRLSLVVSLAAMGLATLVGLPFGAWVALARFPGRAIVIVVLNALMGLPPVVVGLTVYLLLSRSGPLGSSFSDSPMPMRSGAMQRPNDARCGMTLRHRYDDVGLPCRKTMGLPAPTST